MTSELLHNKKTIVFIIALQEELIEFKREFGLNFDICTDNRDCLENKQREGSNDHRFIVYCIRNMTAIKAFDATTKLINTFSPDKVINIGIAGNLSAKANLGDVVVASSCKNVLAKGKDTDINFLHSGETFITSNKSDAFVNIFQNSISIGEKSLYKNKNILAGPIATIPYVAASKNTRDILLEDDRNFLAVEMEAAGIAEAVYKANLDKRIDLIVVKGLCDNADKDKSILETLTKGEYRKIAMINAIIFIKEFLIEEDLYPSELNSFESNCSRLHDIAIRKYLQKDCVRAFTDHNQEQIEKLISLVNSFIENTSIQNIVTSLEKNLPESITIALVGSAGSGITTILSLIYFILKNNGVNCVYINISAHSLPESNNNDYKIQSYLRLIESVMINEENNIIFFIDGIDSRLPHRMNIFDQIMDTQKINRHSFVFGIRGENGIPIAQPDMFIQVKPILIKEKDINTLSAISSAIGITDYKIFQETIEKFSIENLDLFVLQLIKNGINYNNKTNFYSVFIYDYLISFSRISLRSNAMERNRRRIRAASRMAFNLFSKSNENDFIEEEPDDRNSQSRNYALACELLFLHESVSNYLVARYIIDVIFAWKNIQPDKSEKLTLPYIYPHAIDKFCRDILKEEKNRQIDLVYAIKSILAFDCDYYMKAHCCYLLGRMTENQAKSNAKVLLKKIIDDSDCLSTRDRKKMMMIRSSYISLSYLGENWATRKFIDLLIKSADWDLLNRGFYLEYYGDRKYSPDAPLESSDDLHGCPITFNKLIQRLSGCNFDDYRLIDLYTLFSLTRHRFKNGQLELDIKNEVIIIAKKTLDCLDINDHLWSVADILIKELSYGTQPSKEVFFDIYSLKMLKRKGWTKRGFYFGESVADHTFGAIIIAKHFLPESMPENSEYDKTKIIEMLKSHDWGEGKTGDFTPNDDRNIKQKAERGFWRTLNVLGGDTGTTSYVESADLWYDFENKRSINAQIAHDIDHLDNYLQLKIYSALGYNIADYDVWVNSLIEDLTDIGRQVLSKIQSDEVLISEYMLPKLTELQPDVMEIWNKEIKNT
jgi:nucleoside phosphorylase/5'-deoxynucleotidase YfbR-like HD superfamily hydrolase